MLNNRMCNAKIKVELNTSTDETTDETTEETTDETMDALYNDLFIGEVFESGYAYIEPYQYDRFPLYELISFHDYSDSVRFYNLIKLEDTSYEILLSKYFYLGFESTADVYVIDFLDEAGNFIKTMEKTNSVAY